MNCLKYFVLSIVIILIIYEIQILDACFNCKEADVHVPSSRHSRRPNQTPNQHDASKAQPLPLPPGTHVGSPYRLTMAAMYKGMIQPSLQKKMTIFKT
ncbi:hypothetical protein Mgra_00007624 [Meloidogyne graminicola]|uniref:Secreted protein n=1 Tax=Meloidogyne graminicola TaxID=189291 RepID=A0A8S9ZI22_9BILA|nr:hypothetical protein Mgra_00007624 [Meloidogyne graminicola]